MKSKVMTLAAIDRRLDRAAARPEAFEQACRRIARELDRAGVDLELSAPESWRRPESGAGAAGKTTFENQFRADVERIIILDREEEQRLARRIEFARVRSDLARAASDKLGTPEAGARASRRALELRVLRTEMVERNLYLVLINVERYTRTGASRTDLIQEGCVSLFRAVDGFDWRRGLLFRTYAVHWLNQAFRNYLYNFTATVRVPVYLQKAMKHINEARVRLANPKASVPEIAETAELSEGLVSSALGAARSSYSLDAGVTDGEGSRLRDLLVIEQEGGGYSTQFESITLVEGLAKAMERLSDRERRVIELRFGIGQERGQTLAEVARELGVSVERVRQIQMRAMSKLDTPVLRREMEPWLN